MSLNISRILYLPASFRRCIHTADSCHDANMSKIDRERCESLEPPSIGLALSFIFNSGTFKRYSRAWKQYILHCPRICMLLTPLPSPYKSDICCLSSAFSLPPFSFATHLPNNLRLFQRQFCRQSNKLPTRRNNDQWKDTHDSIYNTLPHTLL